MPIPSPASNPASFSIADLNAALSVLTYGGVHDVLAGMDRGIVSPNNPDTMDGGLLVDDTGTAIPLSPIATGPLFLFAYCPDDDLCQAKRGKILQALRQFPGLSCTVLLLGDLPLTNSSDFPPAFRICVFSVRTKQIERVKDALKNALYPVYNAHTSGQEPPAGAQLRLRAHGLFLSPKPLPSNDIIVHGFEHLGSMFYRYRLSRSRARQLPPTLHDYMLECLDDCPNQFFFKPPRCSSLCRTFGLKTHFHRDDAGGIMEAIRNLPRKRTVRSGHEHLQKYLMDSDPATVACEVPLWLPTCCCPASLPIQPGGVLTGHIDVLRHHEGKVWVWDYKPHACNETTAAQQVYLYSLMLAQRGSIPLGDIRCGYFDERDVYWFEPAEAVAGDYPLPNHRMPY